jgi:hypothetical protein
MSVENIDRAKQLLAELVGRAITSIDCDQYQIRLIFENRSEFVTQSPWRLILQDDLLMGSGDIKDRASEEILLHLKGQMVASISISDHWDTRLVFKKGHVLEVFSDSLRYETWEAHLQQGWVVFAGGSTTLFPPAGARL